jgi:hypothetical protein
MKKLMVKQGVREKDGWSKFTGAICKYHIHGDKHLEYHGMHYLGMKELGQVKEEHQSAIETSFPSEHSGDLFISSSSPPFFK